MTILHLLQPVFHILFWSHNREYFDCHVADHPFKDIEVGLVVVAHLSPYCGGGLRNREMGRLGDGETGGLG